MVKHLLSTHKVLDAIPSTTHIYKKIIMRIQIISFERPPSFQGCVCIIYHKENSQPNHHDIIETDSRENRKMYHPLNSSILTLRSNNLQKYVLVGKNYIQQSEVPLE